MKTLRVSHSSLISLGAPQGHQEGTPHRAASQKTPTEQHEAAEQHEE